MGNQPANTNQRRSIINPSKSRFARNSYSLDSNSLLSQYRQKVDKDALSIRQIQPNPSSAPILLQRIGELSKEQAPISSPEIKGAQELVKATMKKTVSLSLSKKKASLKSENDSRLTKLNQKNDQLRRQLIRISTQLSGQLGRKKFEQKKKVIVQPPKEQDLPKLAAMRRQLQNGYKEMNRLKRFIENLKKNEGNARNQDLMNQIQAKINNVEFDISEIGFQIENARSVNQQIKVELQQSLGVADFNELAPFKAQIQKLRKHAKKLYKNERLKFQRQKVQQQYMFQLQRKKREINGEYLPEIKSYANKNYQPDVKNDKKKADQYANYKPAAWQIRSAQEQLNSLKQKHEEYHLSMDKALRLKNAIKQQHQQIKKDLQSATKELQHLNYKKQRYMQMVMGNLQYLMNEEEEEIQPDRGNNDKNRSVSMKVITKGNDIPDQKAFDDHSLVPTANYAQIKIVSVNIWFTNKHQISALQMVYNNGKDCFLGNRSANVSGQMQKEVLELQEGDFIRNMMGIFNKKGAIQFLAFYSAKGKAKQFGKEMINGLNFTLGLTRRERPVCVSGYSFFDGNYWRINKLVVDVAIQQ